MAGRRETGFARSERVSQQVRRELADLLRTGVKDPRVSRWLPLVTLTAVEVSPDFSHAKVFFTSLGDVDTTEATSGLQHLGGYLRSELGKRIRIHQIPQLHFVYDVSVERGSKLSRLIDEAIGSTPPADGQ